MSVDTVDDLHAAEDYGETLRLRARRVVELFADLRETDDPSRFGPKLDDMNVALGQLALDSAERFVRPSCQEGEHDENCGGYHPDGMEP